MQQAPYQLSESLRACRLGRNELLALMKTIQEGFPDTTNTVVKVSLNLSDVHIDESSMEGFLNHPNLPKQIDKLNIHVYERTSKMVDAYRWVAIQFYDKLELNYFNVKGEEKNWVIGTHKVLAEFFRGKRGRFAFLHRHLFKTYSVFQLIIDTNIFVDSILLVYFLIQRNIAYSFSVLLFLALWSLLGRLYAQKIFLEPIKITTDARAKSMSRDDMVFAATILGTLAAIIAAAPVILDWFR